MAQLVRAPPCHGGGRGFESRLGRYGILAQLGEHLPYKQRVTGSSPVGPIKQFNIVICRSGGTGRRAGLKILWWRHRTGSIPVCGIEENFLKFLLNKWYKVCYTLYRSKKYVCVAQLDRALGYGPRCRGFESSHARVLSWSRILYLQGFATFSFSSDFGSILFQLILMLILDNAILSSSCLRCLMYCSVIA